MVGCLCGVPEKKASEEDVNPVCHAALSSLYILQTGGESHAGQIFTCIAALSIAGALEDVVNADLLGWWCVNGMGQAWED